jgi:hypothetical protein
MSGVLFFLFLLGGWWLGYWGSGFFFFLLMLDWCLDGCGSFYVLGTLLDCLCMYVCMCVFLGE